MGEEAGASSIFLFSTGLGSRVRLSERGIQAGAAFAQSLSAEPALHGSPIDREESALETSDASSAVTSTLFSTGRGKSITVQPASKRQADSLLQDLQEAKRGRGADDEASSSIPSLSGQLLEDSLVWNPPSPGAPPPLDRSSRRLGGGSPMPRRFVYPQRASSVPVSPNAGQGSHSAPNRSRRSFQSPSRIRAVVPKVAARESEDAEAEAWLESLQAEPRDGLSVLADETVQDEVQHEEATHLPRSSQECEEYEFPGGLGWAWMAERVTAPSEWVRNAYRWIVWRKAGEQRWKTGGGPLTAASVLEELRHRVERELVRGERPWLRKVAEGDAPAEAAMVLAIARVVGSGQELLLDLTDGWYRLRASLDRELAIRVARGSLYEGLKLRICGAIRLGPVGEISLRRSPPHSTRNGEQPHPKKLLVENEESSEIEFSSSILLRNPATHNIGKEEEEKEKEEKEEEEEEPRLKIHINGVRRGRREARLGPCKKMTFAVHLTTIRAGGGVVPCIQVRIARVYAGKYRMPDGTLLSRDEVEAWLEAQPPTDDGVRPEIPNFLTLLVHDCVAEAQHPRKPFGRALVRVYRAAADEEARAVLHVGAVLRISSLSVQAQCSAEGLPLLATTPRSFICPLVWPHPPSPREPPPLAAFQVCAPADLPSNTHISEQSCVDVCGVLLRPSKGCAVLADERLGLVLLDGWTGPPYPRGSFVVAEALRLQMRRDSRLLCCAVLRSGPLSDIRRMPSPSSLGKKRSPHLSSRISRDGEPCWWEEPLKRLERWAEKRGALFAAELAQLEALVAALAVGEDASFRLRSDWRGAPLAPWARLRPVLRSSLVLALGGSIRRALVLDFAADSGASECSSDTCERSPLCWALCVDVVLSDGQCAPRFFSADALEALAAADPVLLDAAREAGSLLAALIAALRDPAPWTRLGPALERAAFRISCSPPP